MQQVLKLNQISIFIRKIITYTIILLVYFLVSVKLVVPFICQFGFDFFVVKASTDELYEFSKIMWQVQGSLSITVFAIVSIVIPYMDVSFYGVKLKEFLFNEFKFMNHLDAIVLSISLFILNYLFVINKEFNYVIANLLLNYLLILRIVFSTIQIAINTDKYEEKVKTSYLNSMNNPAGLNNFSNDLYIANPENRLYEYAVESYYLKQERRLAKTLDLINSLVMNCDRVTKLDIKYTILIHTLDKSEFGLYELYKSIQKIIYSRNVDLDNFISKFGTNRMRLLLNKITWGIVNFERFETVRDMDYEGFIFAIFYYDKEYEVDKRLKMIREISNSLNKKVQAIYSNNNFSDQEKEKLISVTINNFIMEADGVDCFQRIFIDLGSGFIRAMDRNPLAISGFETLISEVEMYITDTKNSYKIDSLIFILFFYYYGYLKTSNLDVEVKRKIKHLMAQTVNFSKFNSIKVLEQTADFVIDNQKFFLWDDNMTTNVANFKSKELFVEFIGMSALAINKSLSKEVSMKLGSSLYEFSFHEYSQYCGFFGDYNRIYSDIFEKRIKYLKTEKD